MCIPCSFLLCRVEGRRRGGGLVKPRSGGQNGTAISRQGHLLSPRINLIEKRCLLELCEFLLISEGWDAWTSLSSLLRWAASVASARCHTVCTHRRMHLGRYGSPGSSCVVLMGDSLLWHLPKIFHNQCLTNLALLHSWGNDCNSRKGTRSSIYVCIGNGIISHRSIYATILIRELRCA